MSETKCDICGGPIESQGPHARYQVQRYDQFGYYDSQDICSNECLARSAVTDAQLLGEVLGETAVKVPSAPASAPRRRRWFRG